MFATELIGKLAIRTSPVRYPNGNWDCSYTQNPIRIINATDRHIVHVSKDSPFCDPSKPRVLNYLWCDDKWIDYESILIPATQKFANVRFVDDGIDPNT